MIESKSGIFLIAGLGSFAIAFASNALLPILMYRHLPEKSARQTVANNFRIMTHFRDLYERYPEQFEKHLAPHLPEPIRNGLASQGTQVDKRVLYLFDANQEAAKDLCAEALKAGRKAYVADACWHCHSQFIRPVSNESRRWGDVSQSWEYQNELQRPVMFGTRRVGPDLSRETNRRGNDWHAVHLFRPKDTIPDSVMPEYPWFFDTGDDGRPTSARPNRRGLSLILYLQWLGSEHESLDRSNDNIRTLLQFSETLR